MELLTIVSASYNSLGTFGAEALRRCVESVAALPFPHEHLVMDGASTDGTLEFLRGLNAPGLQIFSEKDSGIFDALNKGLAKAAGDYFYVLGLDDYIFNPEAMKKALEKGRAYGSDMVISKVRIFDGKIVPRRMATIRNIYYRMAYPHQGLMVNTARLREVGGYDANEKVSADYSSCMKLHLVGATVCRSDGAYAHFAMGGTSNARRDIALRERMEFLLSVYDGATSEKLEAGIIPWRFVAKFLFSKNRFVRSMGFGALLHRFVASSHTKQTRTYFLFGAKVFSRRRKRAT